MKKVVLVICAILLSGAATLYGRRVWEFYDKRQEKTVRFEIFAGTDYSNSIYKRSKAQVELTICRFANAKKELLWESTVNEGTLQNIPTSSKPVYKQVVIHGVHDKSEILAAYYQVRYVTGRSTIEYTHDLRLSPGSSIDSVQISL